MTRVHVRLIVLYAALAAPAGFAQATPPAKPASSATGPAKPALTGFPFTNESLTYSANWPSGLTLGEAHLSATGTTTGWRFELTIDAGIPGFAVKDSYRSTASAELCSESLSKDISHGTKKNKETVTIDRATATATRTPEKDVGASKSTVPDCVHDALTFLFYARRELGQGRVPAAQEVIFGAAYNASLQYAGAETITVGDKKVLTDKMICHVRGPASDIQFEAYFDRDAARTPLLVRVPLPLGKFALEIVR